MTNKEILQADLLDIVFEHRNKLYGAYVLRSSYSHRLGKALGISLTVVLIFISMLFIKNQKKNNRPGSDVESVVLTDVNLPKDEIKEPEKPKEKPLQKSETKYNEIIVVPDDQADKVLADMDKVRESVLGDQEVDGAPDDGTTKQGSGNEGEGQVPVKEPEPVKQPDLPSYPPEFPGGNAAWHAFLQKHLQAPEDLEPGQRVEVLVRFWVDIDGSVSKPEVVKSGGSLFDKEVLRVLKKMPKWKPAMQYGNHVAVAYTQPVTFMGVEQ